MLIDLHAHTSGISRCCKIAAPGVVETAKSIGLDGIVLTNHYQKSYAADGDFDALAKRYVEEYRYTKACGEEIGCKVFFGIEVTMALYSKVHLLIYGVDEEFVLRYPTMFELTQVELYRMVKENGGVLIQAHPYRNAVDRLLDVRFLDGVEISCHPKYEGTHLDELFALAKREGLILTCGGDYHADTNRPHCGMYLPDNIQNGVDLGAYLANAEAVKLCVQEVDATVWNDVTFERKKLPFGKER